MKTIYCFSVLGFLLSSCMSTYVMSDEKITYGDLNEQLADRENRIRLKSGESLISTQTFLDSTISLSHNLEISTDSIYSVSYINNSKGLWKGLGYGAAVGTGISLLLLDPENDYSSAAFVIFVPAGMIVGSVIGYLRGNQDTYVLPGNKP